jgi:signal transduction histidine kinase
VLFNPIQNATRHTPAGGSVVVWAEAAPGRAIEVEVADSRNGIAPELRDQVFEPFTHGPSRVAEENGSAGDGLAIARAIIDAHGGRMWLLDSGPSTRIRFSLPTAQRPYSLVSITIELLPRVVRRGPIGLTPRT